MGRARHRPRFVAKDIALAISKSTGVPMAIAWPVIQLFLKHVHETLDDGHAVWLRGVGTLEWERCRSTTPGGLKKLRFRPHVLFRKGR
jgi:nucleoid DNA-binding protein